MVFEIVVFLALMAWLYLAFGRGFFWRAAVRDDGQPPLPRSWPRLAVVIPARDEAEGIGQSLQSLFRQEFGGPWSVVVVDDDSSDGTAAVARRTAADCGMEDRLRVVPGRPLSPGWTGKLWALRQGIEAASSGDPPDYFLLTDADIVYAPQVLSWLVAHATRDGLVLASFMAKLRCESLAERSLIPAFIFFFQMLYPFAWVNQRGRGVAAAAGGCMLIRRDALQAAGGLDAIRDALIDDCALAGALKAHGPIWLGLTARVRSVRAYPRWADIAQMVSRSAYAQLRYSPPLLIGTVAAMTLIFLVPPFAALCGAGPVRAFGILAWAIMAILFQPILRLYGRTPVWGAAVPAIAFAYLMFTVDSAIKFMRGRGGLWKGRFQAARVK